MPFDLHSNLHMQVRPLFFPLVVKVKKEMPMYNQNKLMCTNPVLCNKPKIFLSFFKEFQ